MFGLTNGEGNHGEDVKEYWFYLDSTPTHSYLKCQYKYPQRAFPYEDLVSTNARRGKQDMEYELLDTGIFDDDRYFDVIVEYAKGDHDDILMLVTAHNRGPEPATLHLLPTLWFRNTWSWGGERAQADAGRGRRRAGIAAARASHRELGDWLLRADASARAAVLRERDQQRAPVRDAQRRRRTSRTRSTISWSTVTPDAVNPARTGTKVAAHHVLEIAAGRQRVDPRPAQRTPSGQDRGSARRARGFGAGFERIMSARRDEADEFYATVIPPTLHADGGDGDASSARRDVVGQAVLRVRRPPLAARARRGPVGPRRRRARFATCRGFTWSRAT